MEDNEKDTVITNESPEIKASKEGKNYTAFIALIVLVLVVAIAFRGYYFYKKSLVSNPVKVTTKMIKGFNNSSKEELKKATKFLEGNKPYVLTLNGNISDIKFNAESGIDLKNKVVTFLTSLSGQGVGDLFIDGTVKKDGLKFKLSKNGNSYALNEDFSEMFNYLDDYLKSFNNDDGEKIINYFADSFEETFKQDDFTKSKKDIDLFDKKVNAVVYTTKINDKKLEKFLDVFTDKLLKDTEFVDRIVKAAGSIDNAMTKEKITASLKETVEQLKTAFSGIDLNYSVIVYKTDAVGYSLYTTDFVFDYTEYKGQKAYDIRAFDTSITIKDNKEEFLVKTNIENSPVELSYNKKDYNYNLKIQNIPILSGTYQETDNKNDMEVKITFSNPMMGINGAFNSKLELVDSLKERTYDNALNIDNAENASKLMEEIQNNEFIMGIVETFGGYLSNQSVWDSLDGFDI